MINSCAVGSKCGMLNRFLCQATNWSPLLFFDFFVNYEKMSLKALVISGESCSTVFGYNINNFL